MACSGLKLLNKETNFLGKNETLKGIDLAIEFLK